MLHRISTTFTSVATQHRLCRYGCNQPPPKPFNKLELTHVGNRTRVLPLTNWAWELLVQKSCWYIFVKKGLKQLNQKIKSRSGGKRKYTPTCFYRLKFCKVVSFVKVSLGWIKKFSLGKWVRKVRKFELISLVPVSCWWICDQSFSRSSHPNFSFSEAKLNFFECNLLTDEVNNFYLYLSKYFLYTKFYF